MKDTKSKLTLWTLLFQEYPFQIEHCPDHLPDLPDALSGIPGEEATLKDVVRSKQLLPPTTRGGGGGSTPSEARHSATRAADPDRRRGGRSTRIRRIRNRLEWIHHRTAGDSNLLQIHKGTNKAYPTPLDK